jgi:CRISPR-associated protein Cmr4
MAETTRIYWIHALTPLHVGAGRGVGYIDLPIMREKVTGWPLIPGSAVKGVLAAHHDADEEKRKNDDKLAAAFGRAGDEHSNSGSLVFSDARLVCLPVRSLYGTFAWCTSGLALTRLSRDLEATGTVAAKSVFALVSDTVELAKESVLHSNEKVFLEDLDFTPQTGSADEWAALLGSWLFPGDPQWVRLFQQRFAVVSDDVFNFLCDTGTEVAARVRIDDSKKSVVPGALWYEEALPAETVLAGLVWCDRVFGGNGITADGLLTEFCPGKSPITLQIGGKATVGRGRVRCLFTQGGTS